jgi:hypothetical protein
MCSIAAPATSLVIWPAHAGSRKILVRVATRELSELSGIRFGVDSAKINAALQKHRACIEQRANEKLTDLSDEVTLDIGSLTSIHSYSDIRQANKV